MHWLREISHSSKKTFPIESTLNLLLIGLSIVSEETMEKNFIQLWLGYLLLDRISQRFSHDISKFSTVSEIKTGAPSKHFNDVFLAAEGPSMILADFLGTRPLEALVVANSENKEIFNKEIPRVYIEELIRKHIGPHPEKLINPAENPFKAYERHALIIAGIRKDDLPSRNGLNELNRRLKSYPDYHVSAIIGQENFDRIFFNREIGLYLFGRKYPESFARIMDYLLTNKEEMITKWLGGLRGLEFLIEEFPKYFHNDIKFTNDKLRARLFPNLKWRPEIKRGMLPASPSPFFPSPETLDLKHVANSNHTPSAGEVIPVHTKMLRGGTS